MDNCTPTQIAGQPLLPFLLQKQARWLDITIGKFELTEWHVLAEEWFKEKPRNSDQVCTYICTSITYTFNYFNGHLIMLPLTTAQVKYVFSQELHLWAGNSV